MAREPVAPKPAPPPYEIDLLRVVVIGTVAWLVWLAVTLVTHSWAARHGHGDWPWVALTGAGLGALGMVVEVRRRRIDAARRAARGE